MIFLSVWRKTCYMYVVSWKDVFHCNHASSCHQVSLWKECKPYLPPFYLITKWSKKVYQQDIPNEVLILAFRWNGAFFWLYELSVKSHLARFTRTINDSTYIKSPLPLDFPFLFCDQNLINRPLATFNRT